MDTINADTDAQTSQMIERREKFAELKEERQKKRKALEKLFMQRREALHKADFEKNNQYVINETARRKRFGLDIKAKENTSAPEQLQENHKQMQEIINN